MGKITMSKGKDAAQKIIFEPLQGNWNFGQIFHNQLPYFSIEWRTVITFASSM